MEPAKQSDLHTLSPAPPPPKKKQTKQKKIPKIFRTIIFSRGGTQPPLFPPPIFTSRAKGMGKK